MSVSLVMLPVVLALRVVMGAEGFKNWVESQSVRVPTEFASEEELLVTLRKAGYDAERWLGSFKTHLGNEGQFFFWEWIDGRWTAVFSKSDSAEEIETLLEELARAAGRPVARQAESEAVELRRALPPAASPPIPPTVPPQTFPTNFRDADLLTKTLREFGFTPSVEGPGRIQYRSGACQLTFLQEGTEPFRVEVRNAPDLRQVYGHLSAIDDRYARNVQARTYETLTARAAEKGFSVAHEEVLEDKSIVITLNVPS